MISVQNHQLLLSGNKILVFGCFLFIFACSTSKNITNKVEFPLPEVNTENLNNKPLIQKNIDTIEWKIIPESLFKPLEDPQPLTKSERLKLKLYRENSEILDQYNLNLYLPFFTSRFSNTDINFNNRLTEWSFHFYNGFQLALNEEEYESSKISVNVIDTEANPNILERKLEMANLDAPHLIIGPYRGLSVEKMNKFASVANIPFISPYSGGGDWNGQNDTYIKLNPSLEVHFQNQLEYILDFYDADQILVVSFENIQEINAVDILQSEYSNIKDSSGIKHLDTYILPDTAILAPDFDLASELIDRKDTLAVIIPSWTNETYILSILRNLSQLQSDTSNYVVFGMPQWKDYEHIDYSYYQKLNVHITSSFFLDKQHIDLLNFRNNYFEEYGFLPANETYIGYDLGRFFVPLLLEYGTRFYKFLDQFSYQGMHTNFEFKPIYRMSDAGNLEISRWENSYLNILKFSDYEFVKVN
jgi:hypothetical protein